MVETPGINLSVLKSFSDCNIKDIQVIKIQWQLQNEHIASYLSTVKFPSFMGFIYLVTNLEYLVICIGAPCH